MTDALKTAIKDFIYYSSGGVKSAGKALLIELIKADKASMYNTTVFKFSKQLEDLYAMQAVLSKYITNHKYDTYSNDFINKYDAFSAFTTATANMDPAISPFLNTVKTSLGSKIVDTRVQKHNLQIVTYKIKLLESLIYILSQNKGNYDTILNEISNIPD